MLPGVSDFDRLTSLERSKMKIGCVIPARVGSTRLAQKPLHQIRNKPLLYWVLRALRAQQSNVIDHFSEFVVATDDKRVCAVAEEAGFSAQLTKPELPSGSDRVWAVAKDKDWDAVVNLQGDEVLTDLHVLEKISLALKEKKSDWVTPVTKISKQEVFDQNVVKALVNQKGGAIYFSRFPLPYSRLDYSEADFDVSVYKHIGIYGYTRASLERFCNSPQSSIEKCEKLEQLRVLDLGMSVSVVKVEGSFIGVDTINDIKKVENWIDGIK